MPVHEELVRHAERQIRDQRFEIDRLKSKLAYVDDDLERSPDMIPDFNNGLPRAFLWAYTWTVRATPHLVTLAAGVAIGAFLATFARGADLPPIVEEPRQECSTERVRIVGQLCKRVSDGKFLRPGQCCMVAPDGGTFTPVDRQEPPGREHDDEDGDI